MNPDRRETGIGTAPKVSWRGRAAARKQTEYLPPPSDYGWYKRIIWYHNSHDMKNAPRSVKAISVAFLFIGPFAGSFAGGGFMAFFLKPTFDSNDWLIAFAFMSPGILLTLHLVYQTAFARRKTGIHERIRATALELERKCDSSAQRFPQPKAEMSNS